MTEMYESILLKYCILSHQCTNYVTNVWFSCFYIFINFPCTQNTNSTKLIIQYNLEG